MNKLARLLLRRLDVSHAGTPSANAHANGLLSAKIVEVDGHLLRRYSPAFDTDRMSGDRDRDTAWIRRSFAAYLLPPPQQSDIVVTEGKASPALLPSLYRPDEATVQDHAAVIDQKRRAYVVGLVGRAAGHRWLATSWRLWCWPARSRTRACRLPGSSRRLPWRRQ